MAELEIKKRKVASKLQIAAITLVIGFIGVVIGAFYIRAVVNAVYNQQATVYYGVPQVGLVLGSEDLFNYNYSTEVVPYLFLNYSAMNVSDVNVTVSLAALPYPRQVYLLNWTGSCYGCGNTQNLNAYIADGLAQFGLINQTSGLSVISDTQLPLIQNDSVLIILNGFLPSPLLQNYSNELLLTYLLQKGTRIIYVGSDFSRLINPQGVLVPDTNMPVYLRTSPLTPSSASVKTPTFFFNASTFSFGPNAYYATWTNAYNGTIFAFSNNMESWSSKSQVAYDIAKAIQLELWNPPYASTYSNLALSNYSKSAGPIPVALSPIAINKNYQATIANISKLYGRIQITGKSPGTFATAIDTIYFRPEPVSHGLFSMPIIAPPTRPVNATIVIDTNTTQQIEPHIEVLDLSQHVVYSTPPLFSGSISPPNYTFYQTLDFAIGPGGSYIARLVGFSGQVYASAYFQVPQVNVTLTSTDINTSTFTFYITSQRLPLSNYNATVSVNGKYSRTEQIQNGALVYTLPSGGTLPSTPELNFTFNILSRNYTYLLPRPQLNIVISTQYIDFIVVILLVMIEVTIIKAPIRDDFYIDIPTIPRPKAVDVTVNYAQFMSIFDKMNLLYKWRFMPLSVGEFGMGVENNVTVTGMPVMLTYTNTELVLNTLVSKNYVVSIDDLYAPAAWLEQSKHDIEYLATFKKLRIYLASRGHIFSDLDKSDLADIVTTLHNEKANIIIYSKTSRFIDLPMHSGTKTYLAFLNSDRLEEFRQKLYTSTSEKAELVKIYLSVGDLVLVDADNPQQILT